MAAVESKKQDGDGKYVEIYSDGSCLGNPGPGGFGVILVHGGHRKELSGGYRLTTNNRMELMAVITGLEALKDHCTVTIYTDSQYVVNAVEKGWAKKWKANGWMRTRTDRAVNPDLWERLLALCAIHKASFVWVKGHAGHPENERCDELGKAAASAGNLPEDKGYRP